MLRYCSWFCCFCVVYLLLTFVNRKESVRFVLHCRCCSWLCVSSSCTRLTCRSNCSIRLTNTTMSNRLSIITSSSSSSNRGRRHSASISSAHQPSHEELVHLTSRRVCRVRPVPPAGELSANDTRQSQQLHSLHWPLPTNDTVRLSLRFTQDIHHTFQKSQNYNN